MNKIYIVVSVREQDYDAFVTLPVTAYLEFSHAELHCKMAMEYLAKWKEDEDERSENDPDFDEDEMSPYDPQGLSLYNTPDHMEYRVIESTLHLHIDQFQEAQGL